jgi:hypothetical protein
MPFSLGIALGKLDTASLMAGSKMPDPADSLRTETEPREIAANDQDGLKTKLDKPVRTPREAGDPNSLRHSHEQSIMGELGDWLTRALAILALMSCVALVAIGVAPLLTRWSSPLDLMSARRWMMIKNLPLAAFSLIFAGSAYIVLQALLRPRLIELVKRLMLGTAFLLWGVTELMPAGALATELGNVVIALYVVDLGLMIRGGLERGAEAHG